MIFPFETSISIHFEWGFPKPWIQDVDLGPFTLQIETWLPGGRCESTQETKKKIGMSPEVDDFSRKHVDFPLQN